MRRAVAVAAVAAGTALAGGVHAAQVSAHLAESRLLGAAFCCSVLFAAGFLLALAMVGPVRWLLAAGGAGHAVMLAVGGWSRSGLPWPEHETVNGAWLAAVAAELVVAAGCVVLLRHGRKASPHERVLREEVGA